MGIEPFVLTGLNQSPILFQGLTALAIAFRPYGTGSITRFIENLPEGALNYTQPGFYGALHGLEGKVAPIK